MKILLESYGCTLNKGEAEELATRIQSLGHEVIGPSEETTPDMDDALQKFKDAAETELRNRNKRR